MRGNIEVITGPMFSGKTTELLRRLTQAAHQGHRVACFAPALDTRPPGPLLQTHDGSVYPAVVLPRAEDIPGHCDGASVIGVDEAQFWDDGILGVVHTLADRGKRVIVAGLDMDSSRCPFGPMTWLLAIAEHVQKRAARCAVCGASATYSKRKADIAGQVVIGGAALYEPRCRRCWEVTCE